MPPGFEEYEPLFSLPPKVDAVPNFEAPPEQAKLKVFIDLVGYYSKFVPRCSTVLEPLRRLFHKGVPSEAPVLSMSPVPPAAPVQSMSPVLPAAPVGSMSPVSPAMPVHLQSPEAPMYTTPSVSPLYPENLLPSQSVSVSMSGVSSRE